LKSQKKHKRNYFVKKIIENSLKRQSKIDSKHLEEEEITNEIIFTENLIYKEDKSKYNNTKDILFTEENENNRNKNEIKVTINLFTENNDFSNDNNDTKDIPDENNKKTSCNENMKQNWLEEPNLQIMSKFSENSDYNKKGIQLDMKKLESMD